MRRASTPSAWRSAATSREGTTNDAPAAPARRRAPSCHRRPRRVVACGMRRHARSWQVTTWAPPPRRGAGRGERHRVHDVEAGRGPDEAAVPCPRQEGAGQPRSQDGRPNRASGSASAPRSARSSAAAGRGAAGQQRDLHLALVMRQAAEEPAGSTSRCLRARVRRSCSAATRTANGRSATGAPRHVAVERLEPGATSFPPEPRDLGGARSDQRGAQRRRRRDSGRGPRPGGVVARHRPAGRRPPAPRATIRRGWRRRAHRRAWPGAAGSRNPRNERGRPGRRRRPARRQGPRARPSRCGRCGRGPARRPPRPRAPLRPSPAVRQGPGRHRGGAPATSANARTRPGRSFRGSAVPTART